ncbi:hypothetical protein V492_06415 [Pseudogymnoascus sp. VKM F-4246]|nr:hypothetical protein V492_06415 [Pseudogymnoascus sp. VKM F-4246]
MWPTQVILTAETDKITSGDDEDSMKVNDIFTSTISQIIQGIEVSEKDNLLQEALDARAKRQQLQNPAPTAERTVTAFGPDERKIESSRAVVRSNGSRDRGGIAKGENYHKILEVSASDANAYV